MAISLYEATVERYLQTLGAVAGFLDKGAAHCLETGADSAELVATRLYPDMLPLALIVVILGGIGSLIGAFVGSFVVGFIYTFGTALFPELAYIILFLPMIVVIAFRPQGLFGRVGA